MNNQEPSAAGKSPSGKPGPSLPQSNPGHPADAAAANPDKHHWLPGVLIAATLILVVAFFIYSHGKKTKLPMPPPVAINVIPVRQGDIQVLVRAIASVQPVYTVSISPRVDGRVESVNYQEGQMVASNDLLAVIDPGPYAAQVTAAEGQLARDKAVLEGAQVDLQRYLTAVQKNAVPKQQYDDQLALVHQDEGAVKYDEGQLAGTKVQLDYCYIRAPFAGRVGLRMVDPGNVVHAANTNALLVLAQLQPITVVFNVAEDYLPQIQEQLKGGAPLTVEAWDRAEENKIATGSFLTLDNLIDSSTGTIKVKSVFSNEDLSLFPNQFVNAKLIIKTLHGVNLVPSFAVQRNPTGAFVYAVTNETVTTNGMTTNITAVTMRSISIGTANDTVTEVTKGLHPGETIATNNFNKLGEGVRVKVRQPGEEHNLGKPGAATNSGGDAQHKHGKKSQTEKGS